MDTDERLRRRVLRLLEKGVSGKVLADRMGMTESTFSRWKNRQLKASADLSALDGFNAYVRDLAKAAVELKPVEPQDTQRSAGATPRPPPSQTKRAVG